MLFFTLAGCAWFDSLKGDVDDLGDQISGLTNTLVGQGIVLGVEDPTDPALQPLVDAGILTPGTGVTLFLADAASADQMDDALVSGATVVVKTPSGSATATEGEDGAYVVDPLDQELVYGDGQRWTITADLNDGSDPSSMAVELPPAAELDVDPTWTAGTDLELDLTGQGFPSALIVVEDVSTGDTTYTSQPETAQDVYELSQGKDPLTVVVVPGSAFPGPGTYALGVAGLAHDDDGDLDGLNTLLSRGMAGKMRFVPIVVQ